MQTVPTTSLPSDGSQTFPKFDAKWIPSGAVWAFTQAILHGDHVHRTWLKEAALAFIQQTDMPPARAGNDRLRGERDEAVRLLGNVKDTGEWGGEKRRTVRRLFAHTQWLEQRDAFLASLSEQPKPDVND